MVFQDAFGVHENCDITWCRSKEDPISYKHKDLPRGKDLFRAKVRSSLHNLFKEYCSDSVAEQLAPLTNSQRNEALNSVVGKKIPKFCSRVAVKVSTFVFPVELPKMTWGMDILTWPLKHLILTLESSAQNSMKKWTYSGFQTSKITNSFKQLLTNC